ncbi:biotin transporter BioY [Xinfangfangia pollutisoli]|uniref:biotin transporter BioY n=1 Tax=Xinfangfangia pollutisoli TaxID=2865960 RepID=UPI001CD7724F|nr:biotin transporter BioY [Xinfangfangia pollutisoli]
MERKLAYVALFAALIAVLTLVPAITLPLGVPITAQSLGIMLAGAVLGGRLGFLAVALYVALGLIGLPIFAGGKGGLSVLAGPTAGFILGFPIAALITGLLVESWRDAPIAIASFLGALIGAVFVLYGLGILGLMINAGMTFKAAATAMMPFLPGDLLKAGLTAILAQGLARARPQAILSRA